MSVLASISTPDGTRCLDTFVVSKLFKLRGLYISLVGKPLEDILSLLVAA